MSIVLQYEETDGHLGEFPSLACAKGGCPSCMEALLDRHRGLVYAVVRRQYYEEREYADLIQEGRIGLWRALQTYDPERGSSFASYAWVVIERRIWRAVTEAMKGKGWLEGEREGELLRVVAGHWEAERIRRAIEGEMDCLPDRLRGVVVAAYGLEGQAPKSLAALGREMGVTRERVRQLRNEALEIMRLPALSVGLRQLREENSREAYRKAERMNREWQRSQRGKR